MMAQPGFDQGLGVGLPGGLDHAALGQTMFAGGEMPGFDDLVGQVKQIQRDFMKREQWHTFAAQEGSGNLDPARHTPEFLLRFLQFMNAGGQMAVQQPQVVVPQQMQQMQQMGAGDMGNADLTAIIKAGQKRSPAFRMFWQEFVAHYGGGTGDASLHNHDFHARFLDFMASMALGNDPTIDMQGMENPARWLLNGGKGDGRGGGGCGGMQAIDNGGMGGGMLAGTDAFKAQYVAQIHQFQQQGEAQQQLWTAYCDTYLQGLRDPNNHDVLVLQEFIQNHIGLPQ